MYTANKKWPPGVVEHTDIACFVFCLLVASVANLQFAIVRRIFVLGASPQTAGIFALEPGPGDCLQRVAFRTHSAYHWLSLQTLNGGGSGNSSQTAGIFALEAVPGDCLRRVVFRTHGAYDVTDVRCKFTI